MSKCIYDLSEDCHNKDCLACVLDKIRAEIEQAEFTLDKPSNFQDDRTDTEKFADWSRMLKVIMCEIIDKYKPESEG